MTTDTIEAPLADALNATANSPILDDATVVDAVIPADPLTISPASTAEKSSMIPAHIELFINEQYRDYTHPELPLPKIFANFLVLPEPNKNSHSYIRYMGEELLGKTIEIARKAKIFHGLSEWALGRIQEPAFFALPAEFVDLTDIQGLIVAVGIANHKVTVTFVVRYGAEYFTHFTSSMNVA